MTMNFLRRLFIYHIFRLPLTLPEIPAPAACFTLPKDTRRHNFEEEEEEEED